LLIIEALQKNQPLMRIGLEGSEQNQILVHLPYTNDFQVFAYLVDLFVDLEATNWRFLSFFDAGKLSFTKVAIPIYTFTLDSIRKSRF
jgi:hypothetical protein